ncbi:MAG: hypothetical protein RL693_630 [Verrucomicrobiota bacterium]|jgi:hypothetical protein
MRHRASILLFIGGAMLAPLSAFGHGGEFLLARLSVLPNREVRLEITADYGENPMISSAEDAQALIPVILQLQSDGKAHSLDEMSPGKFEKRGKLDPTAPIPVPPGEAEKVHELITGTWQWKATGDSLRFQVPKGNPHNVLLWVTNEQTAMEKPRWDLLIAGDVSPVIALPPATVRDGKFVIMTLIACIGMGVVWFIRRRIA